MDEKKLMLQSHGFILLFSSENKNLFFNQSLKKICKHQDPPDSNLHNHIKTNGLSKKLTNITKPGKPGTLQGYRKKLSQKVNKKVIDINQILW